MSPRPMRRDRWHKTDKGTWTCVLGKRGDCVVRLFENRNSGYYYADAHSAGCARRRVTLNTRDRAEAELLGRDMYARLVRGEPLEVGRVASSPPAVLVSAPSFAELAVVRLGELCSAFLAECPRVLNKKLDARRDIEKRCELLRSGFGDKLDVLNLSDSSVVVYAEHRRKGGLRRADGSRTGAVRQRTVQADLKLLKQMLRWACGRPDPRGGRRRWLEYNPLQNVEVERERDVRRPVATPARYEATIGAMRKRQQRYAGEARTLAGRRERDRARSRELSWMRAEFGLYLLNATGRRRGAIMGLRWSDFDSTANHVTWRAELDKKGRTWVVRYSAEFFGRVLEFQKRLGAVGGCVFPTVDDAECSARPELLSQWIRAAEVDAGLPKLVGGTCHPYRRKWRSERVNYPTKAVMIAGGWSDYNTMLTCYDHPDDEDILAVTSNVPRRSDAALQEHQAAVA
jgi:integrase